MERHKRNTEHASFPQEGEYALSHDTPVEMPQERDEEAMTTMLEKSTTATTPKKEACSVNLAPSR